MTGTGDSSRRVVLLHGLARTGRSMRPVERFLKAHGFEVENMSYPSTRYAMEELEGMVWERLEARAAKGERFDFVTHSMGGILLRAMAAKRGTEWIGRAVMLAPPNQGSEVVDRLGSWRLFRWVNGPAGTQLGTSSESVPNLLGQVEFEVGVIAGDRSINWLLSLAFSEANDGKVALSRTKVAGMTAFKRIHATHPFIMGNKEAQRNVLAFLREGRFL